MANVIYVLAGQCGSGLPLEADSVSRYSSVWANAAVVINEPVNAEAISSVFIMLSALNLCNFWRDFILFS